jgi:hypothetical protein
MQGLEELEAKLVKTITSTDRVLPWTQGTQYFSLCSPSCPIFASASTVDRNEWIEF